MLKKGSAKLKFLKFLFLALKAQMWEDIEININLSIMSNVYTRYIRRINNDIKSAVADIYQFKVLSFFIPAL